MMRKTVLMLAVMVLSGCGVLSFPKLNAPPAPDTTYQYNETFKKNPTAVVAGANVVVVEAQERTVTAGYVKKEKELTFWQRFCNWLASWSLLTVVIVGGCLAFGVTGPAMWLYTRYLTFRKTTKQLVASIEESKAVEKNPELKTTLSSTLDTDAKKLIDDIRRS